VDERSPAQWVVVVRSAVLLLNKVRCVGLGSVVCWLRGRKCVRECGGGIFMPESLSVLGIYVLVLTYVLGVSMSSLFCFVSG